MFLLKLFFYILKEFRVIPHGMLQAAATMKAVLKELCLTQRIAIVFLYKFELKGLLGATPFQKALSPRS